MAKDETPPDSKLSAEERAVRLKASQRPIGPHSPDDGLENSPIGWETGIEGSTAAGETTPDLSNGGAAGHVADATEDGASPGGRPIGVGTVDPASLPPAGPAALEAGALHDPSSGSAVRGGPGTGGSSTTIAVESPDIGNRFATDPGRDVPTQPNVPSHTGSTQPPTDQTDHGKTLTGTHTAATIGGTDHGAVTEDVAVRAGRLEASGHLTISDPDAGEARFTVRSNIRGSSQLGQFSIAADGSWSYRADNGQSAIQQLKAGETLTDTVSVTSADGTAHVLSVTLTG
ncbi:VCBS domain-containing protein, partial [Novosphingobium sp.]|uniref:VCBS domain-containing protein n=1 Tax=Novosphingobium sp. TaxID=1874826 RepID=UPI0038B99682